jgi:hypothetical protein
MYKGLKLIQLIVNPMLIMLAMCIARGVFRDYITINEVFSIPVPSKREISVLE